MLPCLTVTMQVCLTEIYWNDTETTDAVEARIEFWNENVIYIKDLEVD